MAMLVYRSVQSEEWWLFPTQISVLSRWSFRIVEIFFKWKRQVCGQKNTLHESISKIDSKFGAVHICFKFGSPNPILKRHKPCCLFRSNLQEIASFAFADLVFLQPAIFWCIPSCRMAFSSHPPWDGTATYQGRAFSISWRPFDVSQGCTEGLKSRGRLYTFRCLWWQLDQRSFYIWSYGIWDEIFSWCTDFFDQKTFAELQKSSPQMVV